MGASHGVGDRSVRRRSESERQCGATTRRPAARAPAANQRSLVTESPRAGNDGALAMWIASGLRSCLDPRSEAARRKVIDGNQGESWRAACVPFGGSRRRCRGGASRGAPRPGRRGWRRVPTRVRPSRASRWPRHRDRSRAQRPCEPCRRSKSVPRRARYHRSRSGAERTAGYTAPTVAGRPRRTRFQPSPRERSTCSTSRPSSSPAASPPS